MDRIYVEEGFQNNHHHVKSDSLSSSKYLGFGLEVDFANQFFSLRNIPKMMELEYANEAKSTKFVEYMELERNNIGNNIPTYQSRNSADQNKQYLEAIRLNAEFCRKASEDIAIQTNYNAPIAKKKAEEDRRIYEQEAHCWLLLYALFYDRLIEVEDFPIEEEITKLYGLGSRMSYEGKALYASKGIVAHLLAENKRHIREADIIRNWLEECYAIPQDYPISLENVGSAKFEVDSDMFSDSREYEDLCRKAWYYKRAGKVDEMKELFDSVGLQFQYAILCGHNYCFSSLDNTKDKKDFEILPGNSHTNLYKNTLEQILNSNAHKLNIYEKALYGAQIPNYEAIVSVCKTWEDKLWCNLICRREFDLEQELSNYDFLWDDDIKPLKRVAPTKIQETIRSAEKKDNSNRTSLFQSKLSLYNQIQNRIILNEIEQLFQFLAEKVKVLSKPPGSLDVSILRFSVHSMLFFRDCQLFSYHSPTATKNQKEYATSILLAYIEYLMAIVGQLIEFDNVEVERIINFVALYVAQLPATTTEECKLIVSVYSEFVRKIEKENYKAIALSSAKTYDLDVAAIKIAIFDEMAKAEKMASHSPQLPFQPLERKSQSNENSEVSSSDMQKIRALEELYLSRELNQELLSRANALIRKFISTSQIPAALLTIEKLPKFIPSSSRTQYLPQIVMREYEMLLDYLRFLQHEKDFYEKFPVNESTLKGYADHPRLMTPKYKDTYEALLNAAHAILKCKEGWLNFEGNDEVKDSLFKKETEQLRRKIIPQVCFALFEVYKRVGKYWESVNLVSLVMDQNYALYRNFTKENLKDFLSRVRSDFVILWENQDENLL